MAGKHDDNVPEATDVPENNNNACPEDPKKHDDGIPGDTVQQGGDDRDNAGDDHEEDKLARALAKARKKEEEERSKMTPKIKVRSTFQGIVDYITHYRLSTFLRRIQSSRRGNWLLARCPPPNPLVGCLRLPTRPLPQ